MQKVFYWLFLVHLLFCSEHMSTSETSIANFAELVRCSSVTPHHTAPCSHYSFSSRANSSSSVPLSPSSVALSRFHPASWKSLYPVHKNLSSVMSRRRPDKCATFVDCTEVSFSWSSVSRFQLYLLSFTQPYWCAGIFWPDFRSIYYILCILWESYTTCMIIVIITLTSRMNNMP